MREMKDSGVAWVGEIPKDWKLERLQWHLEEIKDSNKTGKSKQVLSLTNSRGVIPYEEKGAQGNVAKEDYSQYKLAYPGTIVANSMNILIGSVGICNYFGCVSPVYYVFKPKENENLDFINYLFQMEQFQKDLRRYASGIMEIRLRVSADGILKRELAFPSIEEQEKIVAYLNTNLSKVDSIIANNEAQIEKLKQYKQSLIAEVVTKGLDPTVPMKDSGVEWIDKIPHDWAEARIKDVIRPIEKEVLESDEIVTCFRDGVVTLRRNRREDGFTVSFTENGYHGVDIGDLVIHGMDAFAGAIGCSDSRGKITPVVHVCETVGNNRYFMYYLRFMAFGNILMDLSNGVRIRSSDFRNFARLGIFGVVVPPISEQDKIVDYLDTKCTQIDRLIAIKQAKIEKLNQYKKSLIYEYVTGKKEVNGNV